MGGEGSTFETLLEHLDAAIATFPDRRVGKNCHHAVRAAALSAFSVLFLQSPSFLSHQRLMQASNGEDNARTVFGVHEIPSDNCIRTLLDPVPPDRCFPVYGKVRNLLAERGELESWRDVFGTFPVALDGVWFHSSEEIHCENCSTRRHGDGRTTYFHSAITPVMVRPGSGHVLALEPEYIGPRDGTEKQDCEINASKRWLDGAGAVYAAEGMTLLGDDLYAKQTFCRKVNEAGAHFLFHTVLELFDRRYILLRKAIGRRQSFFDDIRALTRYWCFDGWDDLLRFMLRGLKIPDPGG